LGGHPGLLHGDGGPGAAGAEYLAAENRILKAQSKGRLKLSDAERATLAAIGHRLGRRVLGEVANVARPDTILAWYRKLVTRKFDGSHRSGRGHRRQLDPVHPPVTLLCALPHRDGGAFSREGRHRICGAGQPSSGHRIRRQYSKRHRSGGKWCAVPSLFYLRVGCES
jgi:hypothetical protein